MAEEKETKKKTVAKKTTTKKTTAKKTTDKKEKTTKTAKTTKTDKAGKITKPATKSKKSVSSNVNILMKTNIGEIELELYPDKAPITVENFVSYIKDKFFDGLVFHRVIDGFMIQGGGFDDRLSQKPTKAPIKIESDNGLKNDRGTIAMARTNDPNSATSQFFINLVDNNFLNFRSPDVSGYGYAVFGKVTKGMDVVDKIGTVPTGSIGYMQDVPKYLIQIETITLI